MGLFNRTGDKSKQNPPAVEMGWRYVAYREGREGLVFQIEPMVKGPDTVYVPDEASWTTEAPQWARHRRSDILEYLRSVAWNRELEWRSLPTDFSVPGAVPGSIESTPGGEELENERLFHAGAPITAEQAREVWHQAVRSFVSQAEGQVTIYAAELIPNSVFADIEIPGLRANPNVQLDLR